MKPSRPPALSDLIRSIAFTLLVASSSWLSAPRVALAATPAPVITSITSRFARINADFHYQITATNSPTSFSADGLPNGLSIDTRTGLITGQPTVEDGFKVKLTAANGGGRGTATLYLSVLAVAGPPHPVVTSALTVSGMVGAPFAYQITATELPCAYKIPVPGLPAGLSLDETTGLISGTPDLSSVGTHDIELDVYNTDSPGDYGVATLHLTIATDPAAVPVITLTAAAPKVTAGTGETGVFVLNLSAAQDHDIFVSFTVGGSAVNGEDYKLLKGGKRIKAGKTSQAVKIVPLGAGAGPGVKRTVMLSLEPAGGYTVGTASNAKIRIVGQ